MKKVTKIIVLVLIISHLAGSNLYADGPWVKLGRGLVNVVTSPFELIYQPMELERENNLWVAWFGGIPKGLFFFPIRVLTGAYEIVTFPIPIPAGYMPLMQPETLVEGFRNVDDDNGTEIFTL